MSDCSLLYECTDSFVSVYGCYMDFSVYCAFLISAFMVHSTSFPPNSSSNMDQVSLTLTVSLTLNCDLTSCIRFVVNGNHDLHGWLGKTEPVNQFSEHKSSASFGCTYTGCFPAENKTKQKTATAGCSSGSGRKRKRRLKSVQTWARQKQNASTAHTGLLYLCTVYGVTTPRLVIA